MKFGRRQLANLLLVLVLGGVAIAWAAVGLAGIRFDKPKHVTARMAQTGGALPGAEVDYLGVPVGKVSSAKLIPGAVELKLTVRPKGRMAKDLRADVSDVLQRHSADLGQLLSASANLASTLDAHRSELAGAISGYAGLGKVLANHTRELDDIIQRGAEFGAVGSDLLTRTDADSRSPSSAWC